MAFTFGFYNSLDGDRRYDTVQISQIFDGIINDGVFQSIGDFFATKPSSGLSVTVGTGRAWFDHTWTLNDALIPLTVDAADPTLTRIDAVVLEVDSSELVRANSIKIVKGTAASDPTKPAMTNTDTLHQHPLAYITVKPGMTEVKASEIEIMVGKSECPFVTAILETTDIDAVFAQWESQFTAWFENVQSQLEGDIATNLQRQIDAINQKDKASGVFYEAGSPNVKFIDYSGKALPMYDGWDVGDIRNTARPSIDEKWVLCNGASYPNIDGVYDKAIACSPIEFTEPLLQTFQAYETIPDSANIRVDTMGPVHYLNGKYIMSGYHLTDRCEVVFYSDDLLTWTKSKIAGATAEHGGPAFVYFVRNKYYVSITQGFGTRDTVTWTMWESSNLIDWVQKTVTINQSAVYSAYRDSDRPVFMGEIGGKIAIILVCSSSNERFPRSIVCDSLDAPITATQDRIRPYSITAPRIEPYQNQYNTIRVYSDESYAYIALSYDTGQPVIYKCQPSGTELVVAASYELPTTLTGVNYSNMVHSNGTYWLVLNRRLIMRGSDPMTLEVLKDDAYSYSSCITVHEDGIICCVPDVTQTAVHPEDVNANENSGQKLTMSLLVEDSINTHYYAPAAYFRDFPLSVENKAAYIFGIKFIGTELRLLTTLSGNEYSPYATTSDIYILRYNPPYDALKVPTIADNGGRFFIKVKE